MTVKRVHSLPVPAVVDSDDRHGASVSGDRDCSRASCRRLKRARRSPSRCRSSRAAAETDQAVVRRFGECRDAGFDDGVGWLGDGVAEHVGFDAGGGGGARQRSIRPSLTMKKGSKTISGRDRPNLPRTSAITSFTAPPAARQQARCGDVGVDGGHGRSLVRLGDAPDIAPVAGTRKRRVPAGASSLDDRGRIRNLGYPTMIALRNRSGDATYRK